MGARPGKNPGQEAAGKDDARIAKPGILTSIAFIVIFFAVLLWLREDKAEWVEFTPTDGVLDLSSTLEGEWDRVCVLNPYSTNSIAEELLGTAVDIESRSSIYSSDSITLLVTLVVGEVQSLYEVSRGNVDFTNAGERCFDRAGARFRVEQSGHPHVTVLPN